MGMGGWVCMYTCGLSDVSLHYGPGKGAGARKILLAGRFGVCFFHDASPPVATLTQLDVGYAALFGLVAFLQERAVRKDKEP